jgi:hypothetical protein
MLPTASALASSNWAIQSTPKLPSALFSGVSCVAPTQCEAVGEENGAPLAEGWDGTTWSIQPVPPTAGAFESVSCLGTNFCEAVGFQNGSPLAERWDGLTWSTQAAPAPRGSNAFLASVSCATAGGCEAVGYTATPVATGNFAFAERWDGTSWTLQSVPLPGDVNGASLLLGVSCTRRGGCEGVGRYASATTGLGATLAERWNGAAWSVQTTPNLPANGTSNGLDAVSCSGSNFCEAVGSDGNRIGTPVNLAEVWDGTSWTKQRVPKPSGSHASQLFGVSCTAPNDCEAVGQFATQPNQTTAYSWNGTSWSTDTPPGPIGSSNGSWLTSVSCYGPGTCEAVGVSYGSTRTKPLALIRT